jgi:ribonucleotide reductase beta subunit family protein with ferritin-like domain
VDWRLGNCRRRRFRATRHDHLLTPPTARAALRRASQSETVSLSDHRFLCGSIAERSSRRRVFFVWVATTSQASHRAKVFAPAAHSLRHHRTRASSVHHVLPPPDSAKSFPVLS